DIKREAETFVDAISASDINALPDVSVLEALQRVPGIVIERFAAKNDPDHFSTEGSGAILRGLPQTRTSLNGRDTFSASNSRGLSFQDIPPELTGAVKIYKNQTADLVEGGISGTIDLITRKPFDANERVLAFSGQASSGDIVDETTFGGSLLYSDRFELDSGAELGVLFSYSNTDLDFRSDGVEAGLHNTVTDAAGPGEDRFVPINAGVRSTVTEREREGIAASLQYASPGGTFGAVLEYVRSDSSNVWLEHAFFSDDNGGTPVAGATFDADSFVSGTIGNIANGLGPQTRQSDGQSLVEDFSLKLEFNPTDRLTITTDAQYIEATQDIVDLSLFAGLMPQNGSGINLDLDLAQEVPDVAFRAPDGSTQSDAEYFADPANYFWRAAMDHVEESEGDELALALDIDYELNNDFLRSVETGVRFAERDQTVRWSTFNWGNLSEAWNGGFATFDGQRNGMPFDAPDVELFSFGDFHGGNAGGIGGVPNGAALFPAASIVQSYQAFLSEIAPFGRTALADRGGVVDGFYLPAEVNGTNEENSAVYVKLNFASDSPRIDGNIGLRYVQVDTAVEGGTTFPTLNANAALFASPEELAFANGDSRVGATDSSFSKLLPSLNVKWEMTEDMFLRFGYSGAIAFPDLGALRFNFNISADTQNDGNGNPDVVGWNQTSGNPSLEPMEADNYDLALEYYFDDSDFVALGVFYKDITNFFATDTVPTSVENPSTGATQIVDINQPINIGEATLRGVEFNYQQFFDSLPGFWSGLGTQFNITYVDQGSVPNQNIRLVEPDAARSSIPFDGLPLQSVSDVSYNLIGIFENQKFEGRLAYNWRDDYLLTIRQVNLGLPVFAKSRGQLDGSFFYRINDEWQVGIQATNILKDEVETTMQTDQAGTQVFRSSFVFDRRLALLLRGRF
ncbi:MAG: TonB-dependent receptor, partial [Pseudomonadota bacterium]